MTLRLGLFALALLIATACGDEIGNASRDLEAAVNKVSTALDDGIVKLDAVASVPAKAATNQDAIIATAGAKLKQDGLKLAAAKKDYEAKLVNYDALLTHSDYVKHMPGKPENIGTLSTRDWAAEMQADLQLSLQTLKDEQVKLANAIADERKAFYLHRVVNGINETPPGTNAPVNIGFGPISPVAKAQQIKDELTAVKVFIEKAGVTYRLGTKSKRTQMVKDLAQKIVERTQDVNAQLAVVENAYAQHIQAMQKFIDTKIQDPFRKMAAFRKISLEMFDAALKSDEAFGKMNAASQELHKATLTVAWETAYRQKCLEMAKVFTDVKDSEARIKRDLAGIEAKAQSTAAMGRQAVSMIPKIGLVPAWELMLSLDEMISIEHE